jgi:uncharacterized membrane protein YfcA
MAVLFLLISFGASVIGAICGIGGGIIIKPTLDLFKLASVSTISFLSSCTVLVMSFYSVSKVLLAHEKSINIRIATPLAIGSVFGGIIGQRLFQVIKGMSPSQNHVGAVQAACLGLIALGTLVYMLNKRSIHTYTVSNVVACTAIGSLLGIISSFLGIGGGPINLVVLYFFFSLDMKSAAQSSLFIILFSQLASILSMLIARTIPAFEPFQLFLMIAGGIGGGVVGHIVNRRMGNGVIEKLFIMLMIVIIGISLYNMAQYS